MRPAAWGGHPSPSRVDRGGWGLSEENRRIAQSAGRSRLRTPPLPLLSSCPQHNGRAEGALRAAGNAGSEAGPCARRQRTSGGGGGGGSAARASWSLLGCLRGSVAHAHACHCVFTSLPCRLGLLQISPEVPADHRRGQGHAGPAAAMNALTSYMPRALGQSTLGAAWKAGGWKILIDGNLACGRCCCHCLPDARRRRSTAAAASPGVCVWVCGGGAAGWLLAPVLDHTLLCASLGCRETIFEHGPGGELVRSRARRHQWAAALLSWAGGGGGGAVCPAAVHSRCAAACSAAVVLQAVLLRSATFHVCLQVGEDYNGNKYFEKKGAQVGGWPCCGCFCWGGRGGGGGGAAAAAGRLAPAAGGGGGCGDAAGGRPACLEEGSPGAGCVLRGCGINSRLAAWRRRQLGRRRGR